MYPSDFFPYPFEYFIIAFLLCIFVLIFFEIRRDENKEKMSHKKSASNLYLSSYKKDKK